MSERIIWPERTPQELTDCNVENWIGSLFPHTMTTLIRPLEEEETDALLLGHQFTVEDKGVPNDDVLKILDDLECWIDKAIQDLGGKAFVRLGSRSPKDSWYGYRDLDPHLCVRNGREAMTLLFDSERTYEDLAGIILGGKPETQSIVVREWVDIKPSSEFRCFIIDGELRGVSQYDYREFFEELQSKATQDVITVLIRAFLMLIKADLPAKDVVMDVYLSNSRIYLVELNPLWYMTDPCLFKWIPEDFEEFSFRVRTEPKEKKEDIALDWLIDMEGE